MTVYLDTSVVLSRLLNQPNALPSWGTWDASYTSVITRVEFLRAVDRLRLSGEIDDDDRVFLHQAGEVVWEASHGVGISDAVLERASQPFPTVIGTLDALHLATALAVAQSGGMTLQLLTHDKQLSRAAQALGFAVEGV
jgi:predicted nucleic acid-binding protein